MEEEGVQPPPLLEEEVVVPPPPIVVEEEVLPLVVEEDGVVQPPPPLVVEEEGVVQEPPFVEEEEAGQPPPMVVEEEVVQPPPMMEEEEGVVLQPLPLVEEEEGVQPPPMVVEEEVAQPPPMLEEEEGVVQEPPFVEEEEEVVQELPDPDEFAQWVTTTLAHAEHCRGMVATGVDDVISRCEEARLKLHEIVAVLVQEPGDAAEILYANLLEFVPLLPLEPAAKLVDSLFNYPGPLTGAVDVATLLVSDTFDSPYPDGGPIEAARRDLGYLVDVVHAHAGHLFDLYAATLGLEALPGGQGAFDFWAANHNEADAQARLALQRLNFAVHTNRSAVIAVRLCRGPCTSRVRTQAGMRVSTAVQMLQQTISEVGEVLVVLHDMRDTLVQLEQAVLNITGMDPLPP